MKLLPIPSCARKRRMTTARSAFFTAGKPRLQRLCASDRHIAEDLQQRHRIAWQFGRRCALGHRAIGIRGQQGQPHFGGGRDEEVDEDRQQTPEKTACCSGMISVSTSVTAMMIRGAQPVAQIS